MKKIVLISAAMGGAALVAFGASGTFAELTDTSTNTVNAGASTLSVWVGHDASVAAHAGNLAPGESVVLPYYVKNAGSTNVTANLGVALKNVVNHENKCSSTSELSADPTCNGDDQNTGNFGEFAEYQVGLSSASEATCASATDANLFGFKPLTDLAITPAQSGISLKADEGRCVVLKVSLPKNATDAVQGDSESFDAVVTLQQQV